MGGDQRTLQGCLCNGCYVGTSAEELCAGVTSRLLTSREDAVIFLGLEEEAPEEVGPKVQKLRDLLQQGALIART